MPKKPPPSGYFYFMLDFRQREEKRGRRFPNGLKDLQFAASDDWKRLPQSERDRYNQHAKAMRHSADRPNYAKSDEKRYNCEGKSFAEIKREQQRENERIESEKMAVAQFVDAMSMNDLRNKYIYLIHVHIFCKTDDDDVYYPAELAIVRFNLSRGVCGLLHRYVDPGEFQLGYSSTAKEYSEASHKLSRDFVSRVGGAQDHAKMYEDIMNFLQEYEVKGEIPPLFTMPGDVFHRTSITAARKTLKRFYEAYDNYDSDWEKIFKVYELPELFTRLKNRCVATQDANVVAFPNSALANEELKKDSYDIDVNLACKFHQDEDAVSMCSKIFVIRWTYIMRDHCCDSLGIDPQGEEDGDDKGAIKQEIKTETVIKTEKRYDYDDDNYSTSSDYSFMTASSTMPTVKKETEDRKYNFAGNAARVKDEKYSVYGDALKMESKGAVKDEKYSVYGDALKMEHKDTVKDEKYDFYGDDAKVRVKIEKMDVGYENSANSSAPSNMLTLARMMQEMQPQPQSSAWGGVAKKESVPAFTNAHFPALGRGRGRRGL